MTDPHLSTITIPDADRVVRKALQECWFSGASCVASLGDTLLHRASYGRVTSESSAKGVDCDTLFDLSSLTKPLGTALAAMYLVGRGRLDLSRSIAKCLGACSSACLPMFQTARFETITLDMLLDHTAGFPAVTDYYQTIMKQEAHRSEALRVCGTRQAASLYQTHVALLDSVAAPGSAVLYSDLGFMVLGWVIESVVGKPLDVFLEQTIYKPLDLYRDLFFIRHDDASAAQKRLQGRTVVATERCAWRKKMLQGEVHDPNAWALGGVSGHAGLFGTADAVWRLMRILKKAQEGQESLFHAATVSRFWTRSKRGLNTTRTLGWDMPSGTHSSASSRFSKNSIGHLGFSGTSVWLDLQRGTLGVVLANSIHPSVEGAREHMQQFRPKMYELFAQYADTLQI